VQKLGLTIDSLYRKLYEKLVGIEMNDLESRPSFRSRIKVMSTIALHSTLNISETVIQIETWIQRTPKGYTPYDTHNANGHVTDDVT